MRSSIVAAIDVGGTKIAGGLVALDGSVESLRRVATGGATLGDPGLSTTLAMARDLLDEAGHRIMGLGLGFPEVVSPDGLLTTREVIAWDAQPASVLSGLDIPTVIESDVRCGALAEAWFGSGAALPDFVYVSVGTGLSYSHVIGGVPRAGATGSAIWMGALPIANHLPDVHDDAMELEKYASGRAIAQRYRTATGKAATTPGVFDAAAAGDNDAALIIETAGTALGAALGHLVLLLDPMAVVVGGGMIDAPPDYWMRAWRSVTTVLHGRRFQPTSIYKASGGGAVGVLGAACAVLANTGRQPPSVAHPPDPWVVV